MFKEMNIVNLLFPRRCPVCDKPVKTGEGLCCVKYRGRFRVIESPFCLKCGKPLSEEREEFCADCKKGRHLYRSGRALYEYESAAEAIFRFKYGRRQEYAAFFGREMAEKLNNFILQVSPDGLLPVPLSRERYLKRGYNQAALLAKEIGSILQIPVYDKIIRRVRNTVPQKELNPAERQNNLKRAFKIAQNDVKLSTIIIVDDIYTTGSTINALTEVLFAAGVKQIYFIALSAGSGM